MLLLNNTFSAFFFSDFQLIFVRFFDHVFLYFFYVSSLSLQQSTVTWYFWCHIFLSYHSSTIHIIHFTFLPSPLLSHMVFALIWTRRTKQHSVAPTFILYKTNFYNVIHIHQTRLFGHIEFAKHQKEVNVTDISNIVLLQHIIWASRTLGTL